MNAATFTKGPWRMVSRIPGSNQIVGVVSGDVLVCKLSTRPREQSMRDACLIAAAPDLYEALYRALLWIAWPSEETSKRTKQSVMDQAHAALAKARGEA